MLQKGQRTRSEYCVMRQSVKGFYGQVNGKDIVIFVAKKSRGGVQAGDLVTSITPSAQQLKNFGL